MLQLRGLNGRRWTTAIAAMGLLWAVVAPAPVAATNGGGRLSSPVVACTDASQVSLDVQICGGASGTPVGFGVGWVEGDAWVAGVAKCHARLGRRIYRLKPGECITVNIGELIEDQANHFSCSAALKCGTEYTVRSWAFATATRLVSPKSPSLVCQTLACSPPDQGCTYTQGYWDTHGPDPKGNNEYVWPDSVKTGGLTLGNVHYIADNLQLILRQSTGGNGLVSLAHQLIAAKLNVANGSDDTAIAATITAADTLIGPLVVPPIGSGSLSTSQTSALNDALADYNEGKTGPGHCP